MAAQTRQKKSTVSNSVKSFQSISDVLKPACELNSSEMIHFKRVVNSREADSWSEHDLSIATQLAKTMRRFEDLQNQLDSEGLTLVNERGTTIAHPLLNASMGMSSKQQSLLHCKCRGRGRCVTGWTGLAHLPAIWRPSRRPGPRLRGASCQPRDG